MSMKAALVDMQTGIVTNILMINSLTDPVLSGYKLVEITKVRDPSYMSNDSDLEDEIKKLIETMLDDDPTYVPPTTIVIDKTVMIGRTRWSEELGFYEPDAD
jgi:hypothetical protein